MNDNDNSSLLHYPRTIKDCIIQCSISSMLIILWFAFFFENSFNGMLILISIKNNLYNNVDIRETRGKEYHYVHI